MKNCSLRGFSATLAVLLLTLPLLASCAKKEQDSVAAGATPSATESKYEGGGSANQEEKWESGYIASVFPAVECFDSEGNSSGKLTRGSQVKFRLTEDGCYEILLEDTTAFLPEGVQVVSELGEIVPVHTLYVRTAVNLRDENGRLLAPFAGKGEAVEVIGYDRILEDGTAHVYRVKLGEEEGYVMPEYLVDTPESALAAYDNGSLATHVSRGDRYGGGNAADLDYYPRAKAKFEENVMPAECRTLYITAWNISKVDSYLAIAADSGINAFVVDIADSGSVGYASEVMKQYCPSAASAAHNTVEAYQAAIAKIKSSGYYVIGRITTFNDTYYVKDHPEEAIIDKNGAPLKLSGEYWPTAYSRAAWQYKVDLAVEAVKLMGFHEIQFDYVRFPDRTASYEKAGNINFQNTYGESKSQAIQRFLMYATDVLHEEGVYVSADVFGESAYTYVTAYGQYWPAISNVVDVISGMPYPDHFAQNGTWKPWEHPYETMLKWGQNVMTRQGETATPAVVRTWIQAYNAIREPYNTYGPQEVADQIRGLREAGCTGGFMTWNASSSIDKYTKLKPAFAPAA